MLYAQCEDDFKRVELNYIEKIRPTGWNQGQSVLYNDLEIKLLIDQDIKQIIKKQRRGWKNY
jgi:hypothetical protein